MIRPKSNGFVVPVVMLVVTVVLLVIGATTAITNHQDELLQKAERQLTLEGKKQQQIFESRGRADVASRSALLKEKIASASAFGVSVATIAAVLLEIDQLSQSQQFNDARATIATISAAVDQLVTQKVESDRVASEAARKKKEEEDKKRKEEEEAKKKAAEQAAAQAKQQPVQQQSVASGAYSRRTVNTSRGTFTVDMIAADLSQGVRVITDAGNDDNCSDNCTVMSLGEYVTRHGGFAGVNGTYFCPVDYASCASQKGSYFLAFFNSRSGRIINEDKKDWSNAGALFLVDDTNRVRFYNPASAYDGAGKRAGLAMRPVLVHNRNYAVNEAALEPKENQKGNRPFIANQGNVVYIGIVRSVTVPEQAVVMQALGMDNGLHLDSGGSTALYYNGSYLYGPGRKIPNAIIFAK